jgi:hypothetical protein
MSEKSFLCSVCNLEKFTPDQKVSCGTGYGYDKHNNNKVCYDCCGKQDEEEMEKTGKITLYLDTVKRTVSNWPGTLKINISSLYKGKHNIAKVRYDIAFMYKGKRWHGTQYGDNTEICHCKRYK